MNVNPAGKQKKLRDTKIPFNNPDPAPGKEDMHGCVQRMCFPDDHSNLKLQGQPKGIRVILQECKSVWDKFESISRARRSKMVGKYGSCTKLEQCKDAEHCIALADSMGQGDDVKAEDITNIENAVPPPGDDEGWCCMY
jgi:hypothetical protein